jgi:hypothetical protein
MPKPTRDELLALVEKIAHLRCDGDEFFGEEADITNDQLQDQLCLAVSECRELLGIAQSGPTREPTEVAWST